MARYRVRVPVRAVGAYRLPQGEAVLGDLRVKPTDDESIYHVIAPSISSENPEQAYSLAKKSVDDLISYLSLLGEDCAFISTGLDGVAVRNLDLEEAPIPPNEPPPLFESVGGIVTHEGQAAFGELFDPDGSGRRSGFVFVHVVSERVTPGEARVKEVTEFYSIRHAAPTRINLAVEIIGDAARARTMANAFAQTFTALEVLASEIQSETVLDSHTDRICSVPEEKAKKKKEIRSKIFGALSNAGFDEIETARLAEYLSMGRMTSQLDTFASYFAGLGMSIERNQISEWRKVRGTLVHAARHSQSEIKTMRKLRDAVREAVLNELRGISAMLRAGALSDRADSAQK